MNIPFLCYNKCNCANLLIKLMRKECEDSKMVDILKFTYGAKEAIQYTTDELKECAMLSHQPPVQLVV